ncbi:MAG: RnfABCDGE type electron transport complex subunit G [Lachnospirales bacterium]
MKILKCGIVLFIIATVAAVSLSVVEKVTRPSIEEQKYLATQSALKVVMPEASSYEEIKDLDFTGTTITNVYEGVGVGYVVAVNPKGYGGAVEMLVGFDGEYKVTGIDIVSHSETPGLGAKADEDEFKNQYVGKTPELTVVKTSTTGEDEISAITSSTITSTAVTVGVNEAYSFLLEMEGK